MVSFASSINLLRKMIMDPVKEKYKKAFKVSEIADYLQEIEDSSDEDLNDIDVVILPPDEVDEMTDIEEDPDDDIIIIIIPNDYPPQAQPTRGF
ncbi:uncharacterized protein LOC126766220 isoform X2 [Bactrocera neohumeralis]|uniref:uncharacterized protein LOC126766220 isoform X2 n=1 Tax=Bactrocera neohumeralis TaxID=98809 RepID=UPI002165C6F2|nr:uncharacterized protein LOC126766220 isoform X2 [Bactrocera neohumeralis]